MSNTAIVIGATGLVGSSVVNYLNDAQHVDKVVAINRRSVAYSSPKIEGLAIDFKRLADYSEYFKGKMLFSCLGTTLKQAGSIQAQRLVDLEYQTMAAKLAEEQGVRHYYLVSSSGANAKSMSAYLKMKGELEERVRAMAFETVAIVQPSLLLGKRDDSRLAETLGGNVLPLLCKLPGLRRYRPIKGCQVAKKMVQLSENPQLPFSKISLDDVFPD